ncbi:hypothetical protein [Geopsychrobacter electrodiphilus]|uniref:hypothetical protein n=1 Tax=Geopsychrobacter electrodiphilus TaxID=225196 RepID=UPI00037E2202|nr:hypothetical protein [Geopsychrobacter electrodiphilus]
MLVVMKKRASEEELEQVKEFLVELDCDFHQSTGSERVILGVVGDTHAISEEQLRARPGVLEVFRIPAED